MQQGVRLRHVAGVGGRADHAVHQPAVGIRADIGFHAEVPLIAFFV